MARNIDLTFKTFSSFPGKSAMSLHYPIFIAVAEGIRLISGEVL